MIFVDIKNDFSKNGFLGTVADAVHPAHPFQLIGSFQGFSHAIGFLHLPDNKEMFFKEEYGQIDYIVDAIDTVKSKIDLAVEAQERQIPIISSMGAANKLNPAMLQVSDIYKTSVCPLARALRQKLKKLGVKKLKVVYSQEEPLKLLEIEGQMEKPAGAKYTTPGSVSFVPSVAGMIVASEVVKDLCGIVKNR